MLTITSKVISKSIFIVGIICILLSSILNVSNIFFWCAGVISLVYFFGGWFFFKGYYPEGKPIFLFLFGYLYSGFFLGSAFASSKLTPAAELLRASTFWSIILITVILVSILIKKERFQKGLKHFSIEAIIMLILSIIQNLLFKG